MSLMNDAIQLKKLFESNDEIKLAGSEVRIKSDRALLKAEEDKRLKKEKQLDEAGSRLFPGADDEELEGRKSEQQKQEDAARKVREEEARVLRQEKLVVATEKYNKLLSVVDKLGFTPVDPKPPTDGGYEINFQGVNAKNKDGITLGFWTDRNYSYRLSGRQSERNWFPKFTVYGGFKSPSEDKDTQNLSHFSGQERVKQINISTNKSVDQIAGDIQRRLLPSLQASIEQMKPRVTKEIVQLNKKRKMIQDTVTILGLRDQTYDSNDKIYTYLNGKVDRFEISPDYYGDDANVKLNIKAEALPALLKAIKKLNAQGDTK